MPALPAGFVQLNFDLDSLKSVPVCCWSGISWLNEMACHITDFGTFACMHTSLLVVGRSFSSRSAHVTADAAGIVSSSCRDYTEQKNYKGTFLII